MKITDTFLDEITADIPFNFPPINWEKMCTVEKAGMNKYVTFEFSHFMSPHSMWPSATNIYDMYCNYFAIERF